MATTIATVNPLISCSSLIGHDTVGALRNGNIRLDDGQIDKFKTYQYSVLVSNLELDEQAAFEHYRDRADCENAFDELKNQWGLSGYNSQDIGACRTMARMVALIYNWWTLFVRLASPHQHHEATISRPLLLTGIARQVDHSNQRTLRLTVSGANSINFKKIYFNLNNLFQTLKGVAQQRSPEQCWEWFLARIAEGVRRKLGAQASPETIALSA